MYTALNLSAGKSKEYNIDEQYPLPHRIEEPPPECSRIEEHVIHAYLVKSWRREECFLLMFLVEDSEPNDRNCSKRQIVEVQEDHIVDFGA